jgi:hypothetical protein
MSRIVDNLIAYKILSMMVTNFEDTQAYKLGIIDKTGKVLRKSSSLKTTEERDAYSYLDRLVFNMKKIINKIGGESKLKSLVAALWLVKEYYETNDRSTALMEEKFDNIMKMLDNSVSLVEEEIIVTRFLSEDGMVGGAPTNNTAGASVNEPKIYKKDINKYRKLARRTAPIEVK